jgi:hypothetical protein
VILSFLGKWTPVKQTVQDHDMDVPDDQEKGFDVRLYHIASIVFISFIMVVFWNTV